MQYKLKKKYESFILLAEMEEFETFLFSALWNHSCLLCTVEFRLKVVPDHTSFCRGDFFHFPISYRISLQQKNSMEETIWMLKNKIKHTVLHLSGIPIKEHSFNQRLFSKYGPGPIIFRNYQKIHNRSCNFVFTGKKRFRHFFSKKFSFYFSHKCQNCLEIGLWKLQV